MRYDRPDPDELRRLYEVERHTVGEIAVVLGVARGTAHNWLRDAGIALRPSPSAPRADVSDDDVRDLYVRVGLSAAEIAHRFGCGTSTVYRCLDRLGIERRRTPPNPLRPERGELFRRYVTEGRSLRDIAVDYGVSPQAVAGWLRYHGIEARPPGTPLLELDVDRVSAGYLEGRSGPELAAHHGCSAAVTYRLLDEAGVTRRPVTPMLDREVLVDALEQQQTAEQIAAMHGVSVSTVCRALRREGLETDRQAQRRQAHERLLELLVDAERNPNVDAAFLDWLRNRVREPVDAVAVPTARSTPSDVTAGRGHRSGTSSTSSSWPRGHAARCCVWDGACGCPHANPPATMRS